MAVAMASIVVIPITVPMAVGTEDSNWATTGKRPLPRFSPDMPVAIPKKILNAIKIPTSIISMNRWARV